MVGAILLAMGPATGSSDAPHIVAVRAVVEDLEGRLGGPLAASAELRNVPVLYDEAGRDPGAQLQDLAFALHASVLRDGKTLRIERTAEDRRAIRSAHRSSLGRTIGDALAMFGRQLESSAALGDEDAQARIAQRAIENVDRQIQSAQSEGRAFEVPADLVNPGLLNPEGRLTFELMRRLGTEKLSSLPPTGVRFFSNFPVESESESILTKGDDAITEYKRRKERAAARSDSGALGPVATVILRVDEHGGTLQCFDGTGRRIARGGVLYSNRVIVQGSDLPCPGGKDAVWRSLDTRAASMVEFLTPDPARIAAGMQRSDEAAGTTAPGPLPAVPEAYAHPEREEPLDFAARDAVASLPVLPNARGKIVVMSDRLLRLANGLVQGGRIDVGSFAHAIRQGGTDAGLRYEQVDHQGVTVWRPMDPLTAEDGIVDRAALGRAVRGVLASGRVALLDWSKAQFELFPGRNSDVRRLYLSTLSWLGLRYPPSLLASDPRLIALVGASLAPGRAVVDASQPPLRGMIEDGILQGWLPLAPDASISDLALSPSRLVPELSEGALSISVASARRPVIDNLGASKVGFEGQEIGQMAQGSLYPFPTMPRTESRTRLFFEQRYVHRRYRIGSKTRLGIDVRAGSRLLTRVSLEESTLDSAGLTFEQIPSEFRNDILKQVREGLAKEGTAIPAFLNGGL